MKKESLMANLKVLETANASMKNLISAADERDILDFAEAIAALGTMYEGIAAAIRMDKILANATGEDDDEDDLDNDRNQQVLRELRRLKK